jgi:hypothetical protein
MTFEEYYAGMIMYGVAPAETMRDSPAKSTSITVIPTTVTSEDWANGAGGYYNSELIPDTEISLSGIYEPDEFYRTPKLGKDGIDGVKIQPQTLSGADLVTIGGGILQLVNYYGPVFNPRATGNWVQFPISRDYVSITVTTSYDFQNQSTYCSVSYDGGYYLSIVPEIRFNGGDKSDMYPNGMNSFGLGDNSLASTITVSFIYNYANPYKVCPYHIYPLNVSITLP